MENISTVFLGENIATAHLEGLGFDILERNWRYKHLEIDIIASKDRLLHIVEVKTRTSLHFGFPEQMIHVQKMQFLKNAAAHFQYLHPQWKWIQFDVIAIYKKPTDEWALDYFEDVYF
jgi:putative endonuclease